MRCLAVVIVLCAFHAAHAQAPGEVQPLPQPAELKNPGTAVALSVGTTAVGFLLFVEGVHNESGTAGLIGAGGMFLGPSIGVWYGGGSGILGLAGRTTALVMLFHGIDLEESAYGGDCLGLSTADCYAYEQSQADQLRRAHIFEYGALALWGAATFYDFWDAHHSASRWNREHALTLAPMLAPHASGMSLSLRF
jgi:hypothetical protein